MWCSCMADIITFGMFSPSDLGSTYRIKEWMGTAYQPFVIASIRSAVLSKTEHSDLSGGRLFTPVEIEERVERSGIR